jgi:hypothetical protein
MVASQEFWLPIISDFNPVGQVRLEEVERFFVDRNEKDLQRSRVQRLKLNFLSKKAKKPLLRCSMLHRLSSITA